MNEESTSELRPRSRQRWVVDTPTRSLRLKLVGQSELDATSTPRSGWSSSVDRDVTSILTAFDVGGGQSAAVKNDVDFAVRLDRLRRALLAASAGGRTVWNLHASDGKLHNDDVSWNARGLMVCYNEVCCRATLYKTRFKQFHNKSAP